MARRCLGRYIIFCINDYGVPRTEYLYRDEGDDIDTGQICRQVESQCDWLMPCDGQALAESLS